MSKIDNSLGKSALKSTKDRVPKIEKSNLIYSINCENCNKIYIGQTRQYLKKKRHYQHQYSVDKTDVSSTALARHAHENKHTFNFNDTKMIGYENNQRKRDILEMYYIKKH